MVRATLLVLGLLVVSSRAHAADGDRWWGADKALHFGFSLGIAGASYAASTWLLPDLGDVPRIALAATFTLSLGAAKELYDAAGYGDPSWRDFTWDVAGCVVGLVLAYLIDRAFRAPPRAAPDVGVAQLTAAIVWKGAGASD